MIRNQGRTISAEDEDLVVNVTSTTQQKSTAPSLNTNQDILLQVHYRDFWKEEKQTDISDSTITIPLSEYVTRVHLTENYYNKTQINDFIENYGVKIIVLDSKSELPQDGDPEYANSSYIFFVKHTHTAGSNNDRDIYDEYVWDSSTNQYERIGNTDIDLTPYMTTASFDSWKTNTYNVFVTNTNNEITNIKSTKADITYVDSKILSEAERIINLIADEFSSNVITNEVAALLDGLSDTIDDIQGLLDGKADVDHTHISEDITDLDDSMGDEISGAMGSVSNSIRSGN